MKLEELLKSLLLIGSLVMLLITPAQGEDVQVKRKQYSARSTSTKPNEDRVIPSPTSAQPLKAITNIPQISDIQHPSTSANILVQSPTPSESNAREVVLVTGVKITPTNQGIEVILETSKGSQLQVVPKQDGNTYIADIPNAQLSLSSGNTFRQEKPVVGITTVTATNIDTNTIRVTVTGEAGVPKAELFDSNEGLIFGLVTTTITPRQQQPQTEQKPEQQQPRSDTQPEQPSNQAEEPIELFVTAEKREENVQNVPISITVLPEQELEDTGINSFSGIAANTPNFSINSIGSYFNNYSIRGLGNSNFLSRDAVGFFVDDVPYDYGSFLNIDLLDLERVEVLRGPQSTLYGRNAQAGVVNIITRKPSNVDELKTRISYGSYESLNTQISASGPLIDDQLFFRLSGGYSSREGYVENTFLNKDFGGQSAGSGRAQLLWTPSKDWEVSFNASFDARNDDAPALLLRSQSDIYNTQQDYDGFNQLFSNTQSLKISYNNPRFRVTSITSRRFSDQETRYDIDSTTTDVGIAVSAFDSTVFSQELRLQSPQDQSKFQWLIGGYFESRDFNANGEGFIIGVDGAPLFGSPLGRDQTNANTDQKTYAIFGQTTYQLTEALSLTAGLRYESVDSQVKNRQRVFVLTDGSGSSTILSPLDKVEQNSEELLPRVALEYRFNPNFMLYSSIAKGYKPSGVNYRAENDQTLRYKTETSWNYEVGLKTSWFDNKLIANLALFHTDVGGYQVALADEVGITRNIANAEVSINGLELEMRATPINGFDIIAGLGLVDAEFTNYTNPFNGQSFNNNQVPFSPNLTYNLALQYRSPIGLLGRLEVQGVGTTYFDDGNRLRQDPYAVVNARLGYESKNYGIYLFANNLLSTEYVTNGYEFIGQPIVAYGAPAVFGLQFKTQF
ncbi:MAG: TonB-dependent receptor [Nostoc sp.]|uniref:TonB-dependent receptor domain-containing protein n=1 Tax=Nostoc sp. TaxID=1180 RepID=UPI002FFBB39B